MNLESACKHVLLLGPHAASMIGFRGPLIRDIRAAGHRISVSAPDISDEERRTLANLGADVYEIPLQRTGLNPVADIAYSRALVRLMVRLRPDRVLSYAIKPNVWGAIAAARLGVPSYALVAGLGHMFTDADMRQTLRTRAIRLVARYLYSIGAQRNARVIFQNPDDIDDFIRFGCLKDRSRTALVNGSGVDMGHFARLPLPKQVSFLMVARLLRSKGVKEYAEAAITLMQKYPGIRFRLVGYYDEGPDAVSRSEMECWVASGLDYAGRMSDIRPAMEEASVFVLPSYYREGTPRSILEALAMGRPVITTDAPGCRETVRDGENGFLVPVRDVAALAAAMERFITDPHLMAKLGEASYDLARAKYEVGGVNRAMMALLEL